ncbi:hypothetical protein [Roseiarcus sp.]|uniref:hypothetical protein n=1 Tax=Roseiarcus sp. TaxID=1969460 RepID=UPI003F9E11E9
MRTIIAGLLALSLSACAPAWPPMPYNRAASLPYPACGGMATLRANLTGAPDPTPQSDSILRTLGVRCVADYPPPPPIRARY